MLPFDLDILTPVISRYLKIDDITTGEAKQGFLVRYRGHLYGDSAEAYDKLASDLRPMDMTPLFRQEGDQHIILLLKGTIKTKPSNPRWNIIMFILTLASVILAGAIYSYQGEAPESQTEMWKAILGNLGNGIPFAISLLAILLSHEFGHYLAGRYHKTYVTLPYFIPFPLSALGTMGAFIQMKEPPKNKRILLDIGIAGPIAGLVVAIPVILLGLSLSEVSMIHLNPSQGIQLEGNSLLYLLAKFVVFGRLLPEPASYGNVSPLLYWIRYFFTSRPLPLGGLDVMIHPIAWAGWAGLLVTSLNLIPAGQLDGGHILYSLLGKRISKFLPVILVGLVILGLFWQGWWLWAFLIFILGRMHAEPLDQITTLDPRRRLVAILGIIIFFLVFIPVPLVQAFM